MRIKEDIESKINKNVNEDEIKSMTEELKTQIQQYEDLINDKIIVFNDVIGNLKQINANNEKII